MLLVSTEDSVVSLSYVYSNEFDEPLMYSCLRILEILELVSFLSTHQPPIVGW